MLLLSSWPYNNLCQFVIFFFVWEPHALKWKNWNMWWGRHHTGHNVRRQPRLPALPLARLCLVSVPLVYTRSPFVSEILGDARLLCEIAKQRAGPVPSLSVYSTGGIRRFMNACNIIFEYVSLYLRVCMCSWWYINLCAYLLLRDQFSWTTKLVQLC